MNPAEQVLQYHIQLGRDVPLGKYCLLPGDPGRCAAIAAHFDNPVHQMTNRAFFHTRLTGQHNIIATQTKSCRQRTHCRSGVTEEQLQGTFCV